MERAGTQIHGDEMQSFDSNIGTGAHFVTLRSWMIDLPKFGSGKLPLQFGTQRIEARAEYDHLRYAAVTKRGVRQLTDTILSQGVVQQNSRDGDALDQSGNRSKPTLSNNLREKTALR